MSGIYRGYGIIEERTGEKRIFVYQSKAWDDAQPIYVADDWDDLEGFIDANPAPKVSAAPAPATPAAFVAGQKIVITNDVVDMYGNVATHGEIVGESIRFPGKWRVRAFFKGSQSDYFTLSENEFLPAHPETPAADAEHELAVAQYTIGAIEGAADYLSKQLMESEAENAKLKAALESIVHSWELGVQMGLPGDNTVRSIVVIAKEALRAAAPADDAKGGE